MDRKMTQYAGALALAGLALASGTALAQAGGLTRTLVSRARTPRCQAARPWWRRWRWRRALMPGAIRIPATKSAT